MKDISEILRSCLLIYHAPPSYIMISKSRFRSKQCFFSGPDNARFGSGLICPLMGKKFFKAINVRKTQFLSRAASTSIH